MIKITSFYPFQNLLRVTQEFYEDKIVVNVKSLTFDNSKEINYKDVREISDGFTAQKGNFGFILIAITGFSLSIFHNWLYGNPFWFRVAQIIFVIGIALYISRYVKSWYIYLSDKNGNILTTIHQTHKNRNLVEQAIDTIRLKSESADEISSANPFPSVLPVFEYVYTDISNLKKTVDKFYDTELIGFEKGIYGEYAYKIRYNELNGDVYRARTNIEIWCVILEWCYMAIVIAFGIFYGFHLPIEFRTILNISYVAAAIFAISWLLRFVKREVFALYGRNGEIKYWAYINKSDKEKIKRIIEFIKSKIPEENKVKY